MIKKEIIWFGKEAIIACDEKCEKAWGINTRPKIQLDDNDEDDYAYLSDNELGLAPIDPLTYECSCAKPIDKEDRLNKWCCRECERCFKSTINKLDTISLENFDVRVYNIQR